MSNYAVIKTGGKQYKVEQNQVVKLEKIDGEVGKNVKFDQVLVISSDKGVELGSPTVKNAVVSAEVLEQKKDDKVIVFKKKRRHNYRRKNGHRQEITVVRILDVSGKGETKKAAAAKAEPKTEKKAEAKATAAKTETKKAEAKKPAAKKTETKKAEPKKTTATKKKDS